MANSKRKEDNTTLVSSPAGSAVSRPKYTRDELRSQFLNDFAQASVVLPFRGKHIEIRDPSLQDMLSQSDAMNEGDTASRTAHMITQYCYVPGTNVRIFELSDIPMILNWRFNAEFLAIQNAIMARAGLDAVTAEEVLKDSPLSE